jgi:hypothetical protein
VRVATPTIRACAAAMSGSPTSMRFNYTISSPMAGFVDIMMLLGVAS